MKNTIKTNLVVAEAEKKAREEARKAALKAEQEAAAAAAAAEAERTKIEEFAKAHSAKDDFFKSYIDCNSFNGSFR